LSFYPFGFLFLKSYVEALTVCPYVSSPALLTEKEVVGVVDVSTG
jgi:hypothetical protein